MSLIEAYDELLHNQRILSEARAVDADQSEFSELIRLGKVFYFIWPKISYIFLRLDCWDIKTIPYGSTSLA